MIDKKVCIKCERLLPISNFHNNKNTKDGKRVYCKDCVKAYQQAYQKTPMGIYNQIKSRSRYRAKHDKPYWKDVTISAKEFVNWYENEPKICAYCGILENKLSLRQGGFDKRVSRLEVDCKDNELGYAKGNIVLACHLCNFIKLHIFNHDEMIEIGEKFIKPKWKELDVER